MCLSYHKYALRYGILQNLACHKALLKGNPNSSLPNKINYQRNIVKYYNSPLNRGVNGRLKHRHNFVVKSAAKPISWPYVVD